MATSLCIRCHKPIPAERKQLGFSRCIACQPQWQYKGSVEYGHKTGGAVKPVHPTIFANFKRVSKRAAKGTHGPSFQHGTTQAFIKDA
jgi:hypothetical protein